MSNELIELASSGELATLPVGRYMLSFTPKTKAERLMVAQAVSGKPPSIADIVNTEIEVVNLLYHRIEIADEVSGEVKNLPRMVLFCSDGKVYSTSGAKACKDALLPAQLFGIDLPYKPPQKFRVTKTKTAPDGRGYINLEWLG